MYWTAELVIEFICLGTVTTHREKVAIFFESVAGVELLTNIHIKGPVLWFKDSKNTNVFIVLDGVQQHLNIYVGSETKCLHRNMISLDRLHPLISVVSKRPPKGQYTPRKSNIKQVLEL